MTSGYDPLPRRCCHSTAATAAFADGIDTPRADLERCLATIDAREPVVQAWVVMNVADARTTADASTLRWRAG